MKRGKHTTLPLKARYEKLNACHFESLHYFSENGTDFTCGLIPDAQWMGGGETLLDGTFFNPNMPTEEIFTSPMKVRQRVRSFLRCRCLTKAI